MGQNRLRSSYLYVISCLSLLVGLVISWQGSTHEILGNSAYLRLIQTFPHNLDFRIEPLYVTLLWLSSHVIGGVASIIVWRFILLWLQLFFVYRFFALISAKRLTTLTALVLFSSCIAVYNLSDNLLRNNAALTVGLGLMSWFLWLVSHRRAAWSWILFGAVLGCTFYIHLFMALVLFITFGGYLGVSLVARAAKRNGLPKLPWKLVLISIACAFTVSLPYTIQLHGRTSLNDFQATPGSSDVQATPEPAVVTTATTDEPVETPAPTPLTPKQRALRWLRILFEYRDTSLPVGLMVFLAATIIGLAYRRLVFRKEVALVGALWVTTYIGTKVDFFGITVLSYRFSLILSIASLFILGLGLHFLLPTLKGWNARLLLVIAVVASYLGHNLPIIAENHLLKNSDFALFQLEAEKAVVNRSIPTGSRAIQLGTSVESFRPDITMIDLRTPFLPHTTNAPYRDIANNRIEYLVLTDATQEQQAALDSEATHYSLDTILSDPHYHLVDRESFGPYAVYVLGTSPNQAALDHQFVHLDAYASGTATTLAEIAAQDTLESWGILADEKTNREIVHFTHHTVTLQYPTRYYLTEGVGQGSTAYYQPPILAPLPTRTTVPPAKLWYASKNSGSVIAITNPPTSTRYTYLSDYGRNVLTVISGGAHADQVHTTYVSRGLFRFLCHLLVAILGLCAYFLFRRKESRGSIPKWVYWVSSYLFVDLLVISQLIFQTYLRLIL